MTDRETDIILAGLEVLCGFDALLEDRGYDIHEIDSLRSKILDSIKKEIEA